MSGSGISAFWKRNCVTLTMVPSLILLHWAWLRLQNMDSLVKEEERRDLPLIEMFRKLNSAKEFDSNIRQFRHQPD
ncbi:CLUMA_CG004520, isoform A [Clunio marinus]|uniref:CLUMA_CG004520, isoform A n=1 Tax=Clunio marinus TaxID=568069 RepID=A0A1J1HWD6_9DIPT|nr:CLUMA_CG004520, isoform A [Clunio marinus]